MIAEFPALQRSNKHPIVKNYKELNAHVTQYGQIINDTFCTRTDK